MKHKCEPVRNMPCPSGRLVGHFADGLLVLALLTAFPASTGLAGAAQAELVINSMHSDPTAKKAFNAVLAAFEAENPDIHTTVNVVDHESYKVQIRTWLPNNPPDVATWFAGNRAGFFVSKGLIEPIDDLWAKVGEQFSAATSAVVRFDGHAYLMPTNYYQWGIYYRKDLFARAGINDEPKTWEAFLDAVRKLKAQHVQPLTIGTRQGWPAAAWFEYLDLRINGYPFHHRLMGGQESWLDPRVANVMKAWRELIDMGAFPTSGPAVTWQEASAMLWQGRAAMYLMGNFVSTEIPPDLADKVGFFRFPTLASEVPPAEVAPVDVFFIPAKAQHKAEAKRFLLFVGQPKAQGIQNSITHLLPANTQTTLVHPDLYERVGLKFLREATGLTQFFDRDSLPDVAKVGMDGFVEFMVYPERMDSVLQRIEKARLRANRSAS